MPEKPQQGQQVSSAVCQLCRTARANMKAHIMPEGLLKLIHHVTKPYDGRFLMVGSELERPVNRPTGSYDRNILCASCDNKLGVYDRSAIEFCKRNDLKPHPSGAAFTLENVDQKKLRLFCLSYVWRASITSLSEFNRVSLGEMHEEAIRQLLVNDDPGPIEQYSLLVSKFVLPSDKKAWGMHVLNPTTNRLKGINIVDVYLPNLYKLILKVDQRPFDSTFNVGLVGSAEELFVFDRGDYRKSTEFKIMHHAIMKSAA